MSDKIDRAIEFIIKCIGYAFLAGFVFGIGILLLTIFSIAYGVVFIGSV